MSKKNIKSYFGTTLLDSIYCSQLNSPYDIQISYNGKMKLETDFIHKKKKYYKANIDQEQLNKLRELVLQSKIIYMSNCELRDQCSDCSPLDLKIFYNGLETRYEAGIIHDSVAPIIRFLSKLISESKWEKIRKKTAANKKN